MQKIKYIIIFTLSLALGMVCIQLIDYQKITSTLLENNSENKNKNVALENTVISLTEKNEILQNKIISLEETLALAQLKLNNTYSNDNNLTKEILQNIQTIKDEKDEINEKVDSSNIDISPNITIENQTDIIGFGLDYKQKF